MGWTISFDSAAERDLKKLDKGIQRKIIDYLKKRILDQSNPRSLGKPLQGAIVWHLALSPG